MKLEILLGLTTAATIVRVTFPGGISCWPANLLPTRSLKYRLAQVAEQIRGVAATSLSAEVLPRMGAHTVEEAMEMKGSVHGEFAEHDLAAIPALRKFAAELMCATDEHLSVSVGGGVRRCGFCGSMAFATAEPGTGRMVLPRIHSCGAGCISHQFYANASRVTEAPQFISSDAFACLYNQFQDQGPENRWC